MAMAIASLQQQPNCSATILEWVLFVASLTVLCLAWWIVELPLLLSPDYYHAKVDANPDKQTPSLTIRLGAFFRAVTWNCVRILSPFYIGTFALARSPDPRTWPVLYFFGSNFDRADEDTETASLTPRQWIKLVLLDAPIPIVQCLLAYRGAARARDQQYPTPLLQAWWLFASLPAPLTGILLLALGRFCTPGRLPHRFYLCVLIFAYLALIGTALILTLYFTSGIARIAGPAFAGGTTLSWFFVMSPLQLSGCCDGTGGRLNMLFYLFAASSRFAPLLADMLVSREDFPFCGANHRALVVVYAVLAGIFVYAGALSGAAECEKHRDILHGIMNRGRGDGDEREGPGGGDEEERVALRDGVGEAIDREGGTR